MKIDKKKYYLECFLCTFETNLSLVCLLVLTVSDGLDGESSQSFAELSHSFLQVDQFVRLESLGFDSLKYFNKSFDVTF